MNSRPATLFVSSMWRRRVAAVALTGRAGNVLIFAVLALAGTFAIVKAATPDVYTFAYKVGTGTFGHGPGEFIYPFGVATDAQNRIYVGDTNTEYPGVPGAALNNRIQVFAPGGQQPVLTFGSTGEGDGEFITPSSIAVDVNGLILVSDYENHRLQLFSSTGVWLQTIGSYGNFDLRDPQGYEGQPHHLDRFNYPIRVALRPGTRLKDPRDPGAPVDADGRVAVLDQANNRVIVFNSSFTPLFAFGNPGTVGTAPGNFIDPWGLSMDLDKIYVADPQNHRIQIFTYNATTATYQSSFGNAQPGNQPDDLQNPYDVKLDGQGNLVVADTDHHRILILRPDLPTSVPSVPHRCSDLSLSKTTGQCTIVASNAIYNARVIDKPNGDFAFPHGVAVDTLGRIIVADTYNHRFQVFEAARIAISSVTVSPAGPVQSGESVSLTVQVQNTGAVPLTLSATAVPSLQGTLTFSGSTPTVPLVAPGSPASFQFTFATNQGGALTFLVNAKGQANNGSVVTAGPVTSNPVVTINPPAGPAMTTSISATPSTVGPTGVVTVQVTVTNTGGVALLNLAPSVIVSPAGLGTLTPGTDWLQTPLLPNLGSASQRSFTYTFAPAQGALGTVRFRAGATADYSDPTNLPSQLASLVADAASGPFKDVAIVDDATPPTTTFALAGTLGSGTAGSGTEWYKSAVSITLTATDNVAIKKISYEVLGLLGFTGTIAGTGGASVSRVVPINFEGGVTVRYWAEDMAGGPGLPGNLEPVQTKTFKIDYTPPNIYVPIVGGVTPPPNQANWINSYPTVTFAADDGGSTIKTLTPPVLVSRDGAGQEITGTATDFAGNTSTTSITVNVDTQAPLLQCAPDAVANLKGWYTSRPSVTVTCVSSDQRLLSGMKSLSASCSPTNAGIGVESRLSPGVWSASCTYVAEGSHTFLGEATDIAGNLTTVTFPIRIDRTPPTVVCRTKSGGDIWPPNHKWVDWETSVTVTDLFPAGFTLTGYSSTEDANAKGSGNTSVDMDQWTTGTPDTLGQVRSERAGPGTGRIYRLYYDGADEAGNTKSCTVVLEVPHDQGKKK